MNNEKKKPFNVVNQLLGVRGGTAAGYDTIEAIIKTPAEHKTPHPGSAGSMGFFNPSLDNRQAGEIAETTEYQQIRGLGKSKNL